MFSNQIAYLGELEAHIENYVLNVSLETRPSVVEYAVYRFQFLAKNGEQHIEHVLHQSCEF